MNKVNGAVFRGMLESGCCNLNNRKNEVDALNVFPVPDGDTGTNMSLTFTSGITEVRKSGSEDLPTVAKTLSRGMLMGARGNSGVILSQIFRGFNQSVGTNTELDVEQFSAAILNGAIVAYKAVMRPVEGTILTVVRESAEYADIFVKDHPEISIEEYVELLCKEARASLNRTPELLPVLKEARVVDSGGAGLLAVFDGFNAYLQGAPITEGASESTNNEKVTEGYRTEYVLKLSDQGKHLFRETRFRETLSRLGEDITIVADTETVRVRIYTMAPGEILNEGQKFGEFEAVQIDPNHDQSKPSLLDTIEEEAEEKEYGIIAVCAGEGLEKLFKEYRVDYVVSGGQTMNPSTEDFVSAINKIRAKHIFILPNNSNIIMAAKQAASVTEDKDIQVIETRTIPQGLSACISFNPDDEVEANVEAMNEAIAHVKTGQVTYAIKDTVVDGREIRKGDYMGINGKDIRLTEADKVEAAKKLIADMVDDEAEILTLIAGCDATEEEVEAVSSYAEDNFDIDVEVHRGDQPVYCFVIGIE